MPHSSRKKQQTSPFVKRMNAVEKYETILKAHADAKLILNLPDFHPSLLKNVSGKLQNCATKVIKTALNKSTKVHTLTLTLLH